MVETLRREKMAAKREIRHRMAGESCGESIGTLWPGCEIYCLTQGQFSLINILEHCLGEVGPADVTIATWTASGSDIKKAWDFLDFGGITRLRFLVDASFYTRKPEWCQALIDKFGDDAIRATKSHCKFVVIRNQDWNLAIRTSMNLNENKRAENFEISDDPALCDYLDSFVEHHFARPLDFTQNDRGAIDASAGIGALEL